MSEFKINSEVKFGQFIYSNTIDLSIDPQVPELPRERYGEFGSLNKAALLYRLALIEEKPAEAERALSDFKALVVAQAKEQLRPEYAAIDALAPHTIITGTVKVPGAAAEARTIIFNHTYKG